MTVIDPQGTVSIQYMLVGSLLVLALTYWREGLSRRMGVHCILLYLPSFVVL